SAVLWAGHAEPGRARVTHVLVPGVESRRHGLRLPRKERRAVLELLRGERLLLFADIHTHPARAFLSPRDRDSRRRARDGHYIVVVPDFAARAPGEGWRFYESRRSRWFEVSPGDRVSGWPGRAG